MNKISALKAFRANEGLSQRAMADSIGVSLSMYEKVERGYIKASRNFMDSFKEKYPSIDIERIFFN